MSKNRRVRISNESVNCYGTRILTSGIDLAQYQRNPVLFYMHERGTVIGLVKDIKVEGQDVTGELVFDEVTELSKQLKKQWEFGSIKMVSANFQVLETSDNKDLLLEGQTRPTITKSKLFEVSVVDIGGNDDAIVLSNENGDTLSLSGQEDNAFLPLLNRNKNSNSDDINKPLKKENDMDLKQLALSLGLPETATEAEVNVRIESLKLSNDKVSGLEQQVKNLQAQQEQMQLVAITGAVDDAIREKRLAASMKDHFVELGKQVGLDSLQVTLSAMQPQVKLSATLHRTDNGQMVAEANDFSKYEKLHAVPSNLMEDLVDNHHDEYARLYKAEYGIDLD